MELLFEEIVISQKLELCGANEIDIRNQRPRLRRNRLILASQHNGGRRKIFYGTKIQEGQNPQNPH